MGRSVNPDRTWPDHVYGGVPPLALKLAVKSVFRTAALLINNEESPVFVPVTDCGALVVPIAWSAKVRENRAAEGGAARAGDAS